MRITEQLGNFCASIRFNDLPSDVIDRAKYLFLDFWGLAARGGRLESSRAMLDFIKDLNIPGDSGVIGTDYATAPQYAALANGTFAHSLELDDVNNEASLHPAVAIFPSALAAAQMTGCSGKTFLTGVVLGYEVMVRLGKALGPSKHYLRGFHPTGTCGTFGAAAAAASILGLTAEQTISAFGIAGSQAAASMEFLNEGAWTKRMHPGWAAHSGLLAALLARRNFFGPSTILEGKFGFLNSYSPEPDFTKVTDNLGSEYLILRTSIKPHSCCRYKQAPIDGILQIMREHNLNSRDIAKVVLGMLNISFPIVVQPEEKKYNPKTVVDAQFSMPFGAAVAILRGQATLEEYTQDFVDSGDVREVMKKIVCVSNAELDKTYPRQWRATVEIETTGGQIYSTLIEYPKGDPENPLTWDELINKFNGVTSPVYSEERQAGIVKAVRGLDNTAEINMIAELLSGFDLTD